MRVWVMALVGGISAIVFCSCAQLNAQDVADASVSIERASYAQSPTWTDGFSRVSTDRWEVEDNVSWDNNYSSMENVNQWASGGYLNLRFDPYDPANATQGRLSTGAEIKSRTGYTYGKFRARLKAAPGSGLDTGFFLYRNDPWQEIDFEFLGAHAKEVHTNVFFYENGTLHDNPQDIPLGFDASAAFHTYEIVWGPGYIDWHVDGNRIRHVDTSNCWIPYLDMRLYMNVWHPNPRWWSYCGNLYASGASAPTAQAKFDWVDYRAYYP